MSAWEPHVSRRIQFRLSGCSHEKCDSFSGHVCGSCPAFRYGLRGAVELSADTVDGRWVEVSRQSWYEHIVAAARPSTNPPSYGVRYSSCRPWSVMSVFAFWFWP